MKPRTLFPVLLVGRRLAYFEAVILRSNSMESCCVPSLFTLLTLLGAQGLILTIVSNVPFIKPCALCIFLGSFLDLGRCGSAISLVTKPILNYGKARGKLSGEAGGKLVFVLLTTNPNGACPNTN